MFADYKPENINSKKEQKPNKTEIAAKNFYLILFPFSSFIHLVTHSGISAG